MTTGAIQIESNGFRRQGNPAHVSVSRFLIAMASVSLASKIVEWLAISVMPAGRGVLLDPVSLSLARQAGVTLFGIGAAAWLSRNQQGSAKQRFMLLTPLAALGAGLVLTWLGQLVGEVNALDWLVALVYLLWAWSSVASSG
jgi:hypothetical protein